MLLNILRKILPLSVKRAIAEPLRRALCPPLPIPKQESPRIAIAGKPGAANPWWDELEKLVNRSIFPQLSSTAQRACADIREAYRPVLQRYGVNADDFFWGSIKNEEAEALYQLVLERKPKIAYQVGTFVGYSALVIAHALRANGEGVLIAVDPEIPHRTFINPVNVAREAAKEQGLDNYICFERGWHSNLMGDYLAAGLKRKIPISGISVLEKVKQHGIDFAFIDGDHSSTSTLSDFLLLKDYLNVNGVVVFHDVLSWPTVAQALWFFWHDIYYFVHGTAAYFALDVRRGQDGLAALERIADESFPTLCLKLRNMHGQPIADAKVEIPYANLVAISDVEGAIYALAEIPEGVDINITHPAYATYYGQLAQGTQGDFAEATIQLTT